MEYLVLDKNVAKRWRRVKEFVEESSENHFWNDIKHNIRNFLKDMIELGIEEEMEVYMGSEWYKHNKKSGGRVEH